MYGLFLLSLYLVLPVALAGLAMTRRNPPRSAPMIVLRWIAKVYCAVALAFLGVIILFLLFLIIGPGKGSIWSN